MFKKISKIWAFLLWIVLNTFHSLAYFGFEKVSDKLKWDELSDWKIETWIFEVVGYLLNFLYLIAFIWIVWSGFTIMTAAWDDEKVKTWRKRIIYTFVWVLVIFLAYTITKEIFSGLETISK